MTYGGPEYSPYATGSGQFGSGGYGYAPPPPQYEQGTHIGGSASHKKSVHLPNWKKAPVDLYQGLDINKIRDELEGPKPLRVIAGLAGLAMFGTAAFSLLNIFKLFTHPVKVCLEIYECIFGLVIVAIELKTFAGYKNFLYKWFPFLSVLGGKGVFYIFVGSLGASWGWVNYLSFVPGVAVGCMGILYCLIHFGQCKSLEEKYEKSMMYSYMPVAH